MYKNRQIDKDIIDTLAEALLRSPSSRGINPGEFIFVDDRELLAKLSRAKTCGAEFLAGAVLGIVIFGNETKSDVWIEDCSIAAIIAQLVAHDCGLGTCWAQIRLRSNNGAMTAEKYVQDLLGIPKHFRVNMIIGIGYPDETPEPVAREELNFAKIHRNKFA
jgi:nitroreductase